jgi:glycosyltransferase involved in cell wall biosynthesis
MNKKVRICFDIRVCQKASRFTGVGIYAFHLSQKLLEIEADLNFEFWFLVVKNAPLPWVIPQHRLIKVYRPSKPQSLQDVYDVLDLRSLLRKNNIALFHAPGPGYITPSKTLSVVVTVHDVIPDIIPAENKGSTLIKWLYKIKMRRTSKVNHIMTDSDATGMDLSRLYNIETNKITTVYLGSQFVTGDRETVRSTTARPWSRPYVLYLGGFNYRKNVPRVINAFSQIADDFTGVDLLLLGKPSTKQSVELQNLCSTLNLDDRIIWLGFIPDADLPAFYAWCEAFIYPSLYEGFGLPVLEAMQFGAPVITSDRASIPEIIGNAGVIINPDLDTEIIDAIKNILTDKQLRASLSYKGEIQAKNFSWSKCAREVVQVYKEVLKNKV